jgi:hypothetical protein
MITLVCLVCKKWRTNKHCASCTFITAIFVISLVYCSEAPYCTHDLETTESLQASSESLMSLLHNKDRCRRTQRNWAPLVGKLVKYSGLRVPLEMAQQHAMHHVAKPAHTHTHTHTLTHTHTSIYSAKGKHIATRWTKTQQRVNVIHAPVGKR